MQLLAKPGLGDRCSNACRMKQHLIRPYEEAA
jgi:hypothetical protein